MNAADSPQSFYTMRARWIFPVAGPPLEFGTITVCGGSIVAVEAAGTRTPDVDLGAVAIVPGLVNAHTHLDLSGLRGLCPPTPDFTGWLSQVIAHRRQQTAAHVATDIETGLRECQRHGTTLIGDIAASGCSWGALADASVRAVVFHEFLGLNEERAAMALRQARDWLASTQPTQTCRPGLSPHAPYSVRATLIEELARLARTRMVRETSSPNFSEAPYAVPLAIHLAESQAELELLQHHAGPFVPFLEGLGVYDAGGLSASCAAVVTSVSSNMPSDYALFVHANYLEPGICRGRNVVYCPRTHAAFGHAAFGHRPYPLAEFLDGGARIALGTDSLASNPDLSMLAEARHVREHHAQVPGDTLLRMITLNGAQMLGWDAVAGSLEPGKSADLAVVPIADLAFDDPHDLIFRSEEPVARVMFRGQWLS